jgi:hypothetical protein
MNHLRAAIAFILPLVISVTASAVLLDGWKGERNTAPYPYAVLDNVGIRGGPSAIYLGNGVVLTANHVGAGDVTFGGVVSAYVPGTAVRLTNNDGTYADLLLFEVYPAPDLPPLSIPLLAPLYGSLLLVAGHGFDRGDTLVWDPNGTSAPGPTGGYAWGNGATLRWGTNNLELYPMAGKMFNTQAFGSFFDSGQLLPEAQAVNGDSGGAAFALSLLGEWQLVGVMIGIVQYSGQPASTTFYGNRTYYADLAYYRARIANAVALPEPERTVAPGTALLAVLAGVRRTRRARVSCSSCCDRAGA